MRFRHAPSDEQPQAVPESRTCAVPSHERVEDRFTFAPRDLGPRSLTFTSTDSFKGTTRTTTGRSWSAYCRAFRTRFPIAVRRLARSAGITSTLGPSTTKRLPFIPEQTATTSRTRGMRSICRRRIDRSPIAHRRTLSTSADSRSSSCPACRNSLRASVPGSSWLRATSTASRMPSREFRTSWAVHASPVSSASFLFRARSTICSPGMTSLNRSPTPSSSGRTGSETRATTRTASPAPTMHVGVPPSAREKAAASPSPGSLGSGAAYVPTTSRSSACSAGGTPRHATRSSGAPRSARATRRRARAAPR